MIKFCGKICTDQEFLFISLKIENLFRIAVPGANVMHVL